MHEAEKDSAIKAEWARSQQALFGHLHLILQSIGEEETRNRDKSKEGREGERLGWTRIVVVRTEKKGRI